MTFDLIKEFQEQPVDVFAAVAKELELVKELVSSNFSFTLAFTLL